MIAPSICLIGAGNMGGAMLRGWVQDHALAQRVTVVDPAAAIEGVRCVKSASEAGAADIVIIAVKPQIMADVLPALPPVAKPGGLVVSVAAGTQIATIAVPFPSQTAIVRVMPNTPVQVGQGVSVCVGNEHVTPAHREALTDLLLAIGTVEWLDDEKQIDAVTGLSGSGPAYVFHMIEALAEAGAKEGLAADLAMRLALQTVRGAGLLAATANEDAATLRKNVTSPNGTTQAGLEVLMEELRDLMARTVAAAANRSRELS
jgi:pyrroline-5-carboxylate reductase